MDRKDGKGTADRAFGRPGCHAKIKARFRRLEELNRYWVDFANRHGYVETVPDKSVDPKRGYPLMCTRTGRGGVLPTTPLSFHVQGTAGMWMNKGMIRVEAKLKEWRAAGFDGYLVLQVHDEVVLDFPQGNNLWRVKVLKELVESGGDDIGVPTAVGVERHDDNWSEGVTLTF